MQKSLNKMGFKIRINCKTCCNLFANWFEIKKVCSTIAADFHIFLLAIFVLDTQSPYIFHEFWLVIFLLLLFPHHSIEFEIFLFKYSNVQSQLKSIKFTAVIIFSPRYISHNVSSKMNKRKKNQFSLIEFEMIFWMETLFLS